MNDKCAFCLGECNNNESVTFNNHDIILFKLIGKNKSAHIDCYIQATVRREINNIKRKNIIDHLTATGLQPEDE